MTQPNILIPLPSTTSTHFLRTLGIPFQFVDEPSEAIELGESKTGTGFDVEGVEDFLSVASGIGPSENINFSHYQGNRGF